MFMRWLVSLGFLSMILVSYLHSHLPPTNPLIFCFVVVVVMHFLSTLVAQVGIAKSGSWLLSYLRFLAFVITQVLGFVIPQYVCALTFHLLTPVYFET